MFFPDHQYFYCKEIFFFLSSSIVILYLVVQNCLYINIVKLWIFPKDPQEKKDRTFSDTFSLRFSRSGTKAVKDTA